MDDTEEHAPSEEERSAADTAHDPLNENSLCGPSSPQAISVGPGSPGSSEEGTGTKSVNPVNRKKRQSGGEESKARLKRRRLNYSDAYRVLLNEVISEARHGVDLIGEEPLKASQIGVTSWSAKEKQAFFATLDRKGRHDSRSIADAVRTKAESEVYVYAQLLYEAMVEHHLHLHHHHEFLGQADLPAAFEIGPECEKALDEDAYGLSMKQLDREAKLEKRRYGEVWLLNQEAMGYLEQDNTNDDGATIEPTQLHSALELLKLANFLELSERVFMNSFDMQSNWSHYTDRGESPSIFCTAFLDFHTLVNSITKRLVQSALYFAMSRLRASDTSNYTRRRVVRKEDVTAALEVLGMKANSREYWAEAPRRCKIQVYERYTRSGRPKDKMSYSEVERRVRQTTASEDGSVTSSSEDADEINSQEDNGATLSGVEISDQEESEQSPVPSLDSSDLSDDIDLFSIHPARAKHQLRSSERLSRLQDTYMEALDCQESQKEEQRLWGLLGKQQPIKSEIIELPPRPMTERKLKDNLVDWRDWIDYRSPWERYENPVLAESFRRNRRIGKRSRTISRKRERGADKQARGCNEDKEHAISSQIEGSRDEDDLEEDNVNSDDQSQELNSSGKSQSGTDSPEARSNDENPVDDTELSDAEGRVQKCIEPRTTRPHH